ncbi:alpha/beta fold hydrolase [Streptodolium elevatio]|uniref:Alpha/beta fold hydrolase n=1 Tax=Streptodolium elevatio TaxID=3157996 RepID=A0ABV3DEE7_9ACTN
MTAYVLVSGPFTDGSVWREVADRLREAGARVHPVTLTGQGDRRDPAGPGTDLETHIADVLRAFEQCDADGVVVVGHGYAIHPVLGAADRCPERVARVVYLDAGMARSGDAPLELLPLQGLRDELRARVDGGEPGDPVAPPAPGEWQLWGSTDGLSSADLAELSRRAAPQPAGTLLQPLVLSGAVDALPTTGVLCTSSGANIALLESVLSLGDAGLRTLVDRQVTFFELATGHWPMLTAPDELADVLLRATAGEGHVLAAPEDGREPGHLKGFLLDVPPGPRERIGAVDLHLPATVSPRPAVVFVHGGPVPPDAAVTPRDWPGLVGYARLAASLGAVGAVVEHRLHGLGDFDRSAADVAAAVEQVRAHPRVDGDRIALWFLSAGGLLSTDWLAAPPEWLGCVAVSYPVLAPLPNWGLSDSRFRPADALGGVGRLPVVLTRVELEHPAIAATVAEFVAAAESVGADLEVVDVPQAHHGFETIDHTDAARAAVWRSMGSVLGHLGIPVAPADATGGVPGSGASGFDVSGAGGPVAV